MIRRNFFRTIFGAVAATIAAPLIPAAPIIHPGIIWCPYIPIIRRCMPNLIAADIIGVQPISGPAGTVFTMPLDIGPIDIVQRNRITCQKRN